MCCRGVDSWRVTRLESRLESHFCDSWLDSSHGPLRLATRLGLNPLTRTSHVESRSSHLATGRSWSETVETESVQIFLSKIKLFLCSDWHYHWLQWLVMILMNIEYNVWLGHDSTTLCDSTRDPCDSWLDSTRALISVNRDSTRTRPSWLVTRLGTRPKWLVNSSDVLHLKNCNTCSKVRAMSAWQTIYLPTLSYRRFPPNTAYNSNIAQYILELIAT